MSLQHVIFQDKPQLDRHIHLVVQRGRLPSGTFEKQYEDTASSVLLETGVLLLFVFLSRPDVTCALRVLLW